MSAFSIEKTTTLCVLALLDLQVTFKCMSLFLVDWALSDTTNPLT